VAVDPDRIARAATQGKLTQLTLAHLHDHAAARLRDGGEGEALWGAARIALLEAAVVSNEAAIPQRLERSSRQVRRQRLLAAPGRLAEPQLLAGTKQPQLLR